MRRILLVIMCGLLALLGACQSPSVAAATPTPTVTATPAPTPVSTPTPTPVSTTTVEPEPLRVTVMATGDLMCLAGQLSAAHVGGGYDFDYVFSEVKDILSSADLTVGNLETLIAKGHPYTAFNSSSSDDEEEDEPSSSPGAGPSSSESVEPSGSESASAEPSGENGAEVSANADLSFQHETWSERQPQLIGPRINGPETYLSAVVDAGFDVLVNANNHINDYGVDGIQKTLAQLDAYGIAHTGAYAAEGEKAPLVVDVQGIKIGFVAYTDHLNDSSGANKALIDLYNKDAAAADIAAAREAGADFVVAYMHWGTENTHEVDRTQRSIAQFLADSGADLILGSHPHCMQEFEMLETERGSVPVIYSLGNFVSSMASRSMNKDGMILKFVLEKDLQAGVTTLGAMSYIPTLCTNTNAGRFTVLPADADSAEGSSSLTSSRERTIDVLGTDIAQPE